MGNRSGANDRTWTTRSLIFTVIGLSGALVFVMFGDTAYVQRADKTGVPLAAETPPAADYNHAPKLPFNSRDYSFRFDQLEEAYRAPGEHTHRLEGEKYGFESLSFIVTETEPNGGPNLHVHDVEEAHVLLEGTAKYRMGDETFSVDAPYIVKVPAGVPHTFINAGKKPFNLVAVFASKRLTSKRLAPNPFVKPVLKK